MQNELLSEEREEKVGGRGCRTAGDRSLPSNCHLAGGHHPSESRHHCQCSQLRPVGLFCALPRLHRQRHPFGAAELQLREACRALMSAQGYPEPNGRAKLTRGYNLPDRHVFHTVGPIVSNQVTQRDPRKLADCHRSCLELAAEHELHSVAFCCISTGEFHFPNEDTAKITVNTVTEVLTQNTSIQKVIFNVLKDIDEKIYRTLLGADRPSEENA